VFKNIKYLTVTHPLISVSHVDFSVLNSTKHATILLKHTQALRTAKHWLYLSKCEICGFHLVTTVTIVL